MGIYKSSPSTVQTPGAIQLAHAALLKPQEWLQTRYGIYKSSPSTAQTPGVHGYRPGMGIYKTSPSTAQTPGVATDQVWASIRARPALLKPQSGYIPGMASIRARPALFKPQSGYRPGMGIYKTSPSTAQTPGVATDQVWGSIRACPALLKPQELYRSPMQHCSNPRSGYRPGMGIYKSSPSTAQTPEWLHTRYGHY